MIYRDLEVMLKGLERQDEVDLAVDSDFSSLFH